MDLKERLKLVTAQEKYGSKITRDKKDKKKGKPAPKIVKGKSTLKPNKKLPEKVSNIKSPLEQKKINKPKIVSKVKTYKNKPGFLKRMSFFLFKLFIFFIIIISATIFILNKQVLKLHLTDENIPNLHSMINYKPPIGSEVYSDDNKKIAEFYKERRIVVPLEGIPKMLINAFIATEDSRFYEHEGFDIISIIRAFISNYLAGRIVEGGSTITQQVARAFILSSERSYTRKLKEVILAYQIEKKLDKNIILYLYLNHIYLGAGAYGVEAAAQNYFGKSVGQLNLAECSSIAGLPQAPSRYSPLKNYSQFKARQKYVLRRMYNEGMISSDDALIAYNTPLYLIKKRNLFLEEAPFFSEYVRIYVEEKYGENALYKNGLKIYTTLNTFMQKHAKTALNTGLLNIEERQKHKEQVQGAILTIEAKTGYVRTMLGGRDFKENQFNRALQAKRQPGSAFKPIVYTAALDKDYNAATIVYDSAVVIEDHNLKWKPKNYEKKFYGPTTLRDALALSRNLVSIKIVQDIGIDYVIEYARKFGITSEMNKDLSIALGSNGLSLLELVSAYNVFNTNGMLVKPIFIKKIIDRDGKVLEENKPEKKRAISASTAYCMTSLLKGVVTRGTAKRVKELKRPVAGKTGSTNNLTDAWFIGYTPRYVTGVWVGFDQFKSLGKKETGSVAASPIWLDYTKKILEGKTIKDFKRPAGVVCTTVDAHTGYLAGPKSTKIFKECFKRNNMPKRTPKNNQINTKDFYKKNF